MTQIKCQDLSVQYSNVKALDGLDYTIDGGGIVGLLGQNGAGKTTLLRILAGLEMNYNGNVEIEGMKPSHLTKNFVSYQPDHIPFNKKYTCRQAMELYEYFFQDFDRSRCQKMLANFELSENRKIREMSKGMQDKLVISLTLSRRAKIFLLDEPISGVDVAARRDVRDIILDSYDPESILLISTHMLRTIEPLIDRVLILKDGKAMLDDETDRIRAIYGKGLEEISEEVF